MNATESKGAPVSTTVLTVNDERWQLQLVSVRRKASDWFVQFVALGPRAHTIFLRTDVTPFERPGASRALARIREWLGRNESRPCAILDAGGRF